MLSPTRTSCGRRCDLAAPAILARAQNSTDSAGAAPTILRLERRNIEVNGRMASVYGIRQPNGAFGVTTEVGKPFRVRVENGIDEPSLIHWHGLTPPWRQDGVPGISGPPIPAGGSADYDFPLRFGGTFWMHSHQGLQEQRLMSAPLIIHDQRDRPDEQEVVVMLADFSFTPSEQIFENLKNSGSMAGMAKPAVAMASTSNMTMAKGPSAPDLNDVKYDAFLANFRTLADPEIVKVEPGGRLLLRIINGSSMSAFHVGLGALDGELIAVDGFEVEPIRGRAFPVAVAQRLDIRVSLPPGPGAYPVLAQVEGERGQTGIILVAGGAAVSRIPDAAETPSPALTLDLERSLRAQKPLGPAQSRPRSYPQPHRRDGRLCVVDQQRGLEQGHAARSLWPRASGSSLCSSTRRRCPTRCICTGMSSRWWRSTASAFRARCAIRSWSPPDGAWSSRSTPTIRAGGRSTATSSTTWRRACSRRSSTCDGRRRLRASVWIVLARRRFAAKHPEHGVWISLDFLGFSRPNRDLSMGYEGFSAKNFSSRFFRSVRSVPMGTRSHGDAEGRTVHGASLF